MTSSAPRPHLSRVRSLAVSTLVAGFAALGISGSDAFGATRGGLTITPRVVPTCTSFSLALMQSTLGVKIVGPIEVAESSSLAIDNFEDCEALTPRFGAGSAATIDLKAGVKLAVFEKFRSLNYDKNGRPSSPLSGLGAGAFSYTTGTGIGLDSTVAVLRRGTVMVIMAPASVGKVEKLVKELLPKI